MPSSRTKIVATLGPATRNEQAARSLIDAGTDAIRLNFSYGTQAEHREAFALVRRLSEEAGRPVAVMQDLQGPKIRIGSLPDGSRALEPGDRATFTTEDVAGASHVPVRFAGLPRAVQEGSRILLGDGEVELRVESVKGQEVTARVVEGGVLKENQGVNLPGADLGDDALTAKDLADLSLGLELGVDYVALSFVRRGDDIRRLKGLIEESGIHVPIIAKLEKREGIEALGEILELADGVMVARGDLGLEMGPEKVPLLQKEIIREANRRGVLAITATQMLESMIESPRPTRAEASDVANAILDGTDAVMLSAETAVGRYPAQAVRMMRRVAAEAERGLTYESSSRAQGNHAHAMSHAAADLARDVGAAAVVVFTRSGYSARLMCNERPHVPILAFTPSEAVRRQLALWWGVTPLPAAFDAPVEVMIPRSDRYLVERGLMEKGQMIVIVRWSSLDAGAGANFVQLYRLSGGP